MRWIKNLNDPTLVGPMVYKGKVQAGATQAIAEGQLLERTADTNTRWIPIDSDHDATAGSGLAIAAHPIASGDLAGFYDILVVARPGDVFEADLAAAAAVEPETALYYSSPTALATSGSNILGYSVAGPNHPAGQNRLSQGQLGDNGETFRSTSKVWFTFRAAVSFYKTIQKA